MARLLGTGMGSRLGIELRELGEARTLAVRGELDLATGPVLEGAVVRLCADGARRVVLDLSGLEFIDAAGLHAVSAARETCRTAGAEFGLVPGRSQLRRLFRISGMAGGFPAGDRDDQAHGGAHEPAGQSPEGDPHMGSLPGELP